MDGNTLTLDGIPGVRTFTDRPVRETTDVSLSDFVALWDGEHGDFGQVPPNADLSIFDDGGPPENVVVELVSAQQLDSNSVAFEVVVIGGSPPVGDFGAVSAFVDSRCTTVPTSCDPTLCNR
jgi:hypothetical protein